MSEDRYYRPEAMDDFTASLDFVYKTIRERVAKGGERGWMDASYRRPAGRGCE